MMDQDNCFDTFLLHTMDAFLSNSVDLIFIKDTELRYVAASQTFTSMVGLETRHELCGKTDFDIFDQALAEKYTVDDRLLLEHGSPIVNLVEPLPAQGGRPRYSSTSKYLIRNDAGQVIGLYGICRDVTAKIELEEEREYRALSHEMFEDVLQADITENRLLRASVGRWNQDLNLADGCAFTDAIETLASKYIHPNYAQAFRDYYAPEKLLQDFNNGVTEFSHITSQRVGGSDYRWIEFRSRLYASKFSHTLRIACFLTDLDDEIRTQEQLRHRADTDALTGLLNRESIVRKIGECLTSATGSDCMHALLFIDLDYFKQINDTMGHRYGDLLLQKVAKCLSACFRQSDLVGRVGGDEFLVLLKNVKSKQDAAAKAQEIFHLIPYCKVAGHPDQRITCSVGVALYEGDGKTLDQLYEEADRAMYKSKEAGKNTISFY